MKQKAHSLHIPLTMEKIRTFSWWIKRVGLGLALLIVAAVVADFIFTWPRPKDDTYIEQAAVRVQGYYKEQSAALGMPDTNKLSKVCYHDNGGIGSSTRGGLVCSISVSVSVPAQAPYSKAYAKQISSQIKPAFLKEGLYVEPESYMNGQNTGPYVSEYEIIAAAEYHADCQMDVSYVLPTSSSAARLLYDLGCNKIYAQDTPPGFTYDPAQYTNGVKG